MVHDLPRPAPPARLRTLAAAGGLPITPRFAVPVARRAVTNAAAAEPGPVAAGRPVQAGVTQQTSALQPISNTDAPRRSYAAAAASGLDGAPSREPGAADAPTPSTAMAGLRLDGGEADDDLEEDEDNDGISLLLRAHAYAEANV